MAFFSKWTDEEKNKALFELLADHETRTKKETVDDVEPTSLTQSFEDMVRAENEKTRYNWPLQCLQDTLGGYWAGEMYTIGGTTGIGKSLLAAYLSLRFIMDGGKVLYFSTEMPSREITKRLWTMWRGFTGDKDNFLSLYLDFGDDKHSITPDLIEMMIERNKKLATDGLDRKYDLVVVDNLHWFMRGGESVADDIGIVTRKMKEISLKYDCSVLLVSHVNRLGSEENTTPPMSRLKGSSYIEQDSDAVIMITRLKENGVSTRYSVISLEKNRRNGKTFADQKLYVDENLCFKQEGTLNVG